MAHKKNKTEILESIIHKQELDYSHYWTYYWDYDYDDEIYYQCDGCGGYYCDGYCCIDYKYLPEELQPLNVEYVSKRGIRISQSNYRHGMLIDMDSIYTKQELRQKRIDYLLGIDQISKTTLSDFWNNKK